MFESLIFPIKAYRDLPSLLTFHRFMGGPSHTFPGGLNKWQWKRMHVKEKRPLDHEKKIFQARTSSSIVVGKLSTNLSNFRKSWYFSSSVMGSGMRLKGGCRGLVSMNLIGKMDLRCYSMGRHIKKSQKSGAPNRARFSRHKHQDDASGDEERGLTKHVSERKESYPRFEANESDVSVDDDDDDSDSDVDENSGRLKWMLSSAELVKSDKKLTKGVRLQFLEKKDDLSRHVNAQANFEEQAAESFLTSKRFDECDISLLTVKALTEAGYVQMTTVQEATLTACLEGMDVAVKAKTGSGKTAAFLIPAIETVIKSSKKNTDLPILPVYVLIICPTRELVIQIAAEATIFLKHHDEISVKTLIGGSPFNVDQSLLESDPSQIVVATPGRLLEHIENTSGFSVRLMALRMLILDEADFLLDLRFRNNIEKIIDCLPRQGRQSLLFSATIPKQVRGICQLVLKRDHAYIDTVGLSGLETNVQVRQAYLVAPHVEHLQIVYHLLEKHISEVADFKIIVFCSTSMMARLMFSLLREMQLNVREMHTKKPQITRTHISDEFKESKRLVMVTSDVSARGMNYPDVTLVIQVGIPPDREEYIHRLGRTGRQGKAGAGVLLLAHWEEYFMDAIKDLPLEKISPPMIERSVRVKIQESMSKIDTSIKEATYISWLGHYNSIKYIGRDKTRLVGLAQSFSESIGLEMPPSLFGKTVLKMGLKGVPGITIKKRKKKGKY